jgi:hypothetical protein
VESWESREFQPKTLKRIERLFSPKSVFVSPIIFFGTYFLVSSIPDDKIAYFYAFQNGFWYYIFNKIDLKVKRENT